MIGTQVVNVVVNKLILIVVFVDYKASTCWCAQWLLDLVVEVVVLLITLIVFLADK